MIERKEKVRDMKRKSVRRSLLLFLCLCMLISGTAYAQDGNEDSQSAETTEGQEQEGQEKQLIQEIQKYIREH